MDNPQIEDLQPSEQRAYYRDRLAALDGMADKPEYSVTTFRTPNSVAADLLEVMKAHWPKRQ